MSEQKVNPQNEATSTHSETEEMSAQEILAEAWNNRHENWDPDEVFDDQFLSDLGLGEEVIEDEEVEYPHCVHCGAEIFPGQAFCSRCGAYIAEQRTQEEEGQAHRANMLVKAGLIGVVILAALALIAVFMTPSHDLQPLFDSYCTEDFATISEGGSQLIVDTNPGNEAGVFSQEAFDAIVNINDEIGLPDEVAEQMKETRGSEGSQTASVHDVEVVWSYHPDKGLEVTYTVID